MATTANKDPSVENYETTLPNWTKMLEKLENNMTELMSNLMKKQTKRIEEMEDKNTKRFEKMEKLYLERLEKLEDKLQDSMKSQNERIDKLEEEIQGIATSQTRRIEQIESEIHDFGCQSTRLSTESASQQEQIDELLEEIEIKSSVIEDLQQYSRRNCLVITGLPERRGENTDEVIQNFAASKLDVVINDTDIDRTHRLGKPTVGKPRPIIAKFSRYNVRHRVIKERRKLKGQNIGVQEHLTPFTQHLLSKAKGLSKRAPWVKNVWTWDGKVTLLVETTNIKKKVIVTCQEDLNKIWKEGESTPSRKKRITDPNYTTVEWDKTVKND